MSTILYKDKSNRILPKYIIIISLALLTINLLAFYLIYSTYNNREVVSFVQIDQPDSTSNSDNSLPSFDGERPNKAFTVNREFSDSITGIKFKYPADWQVSLINGVILVKKDTCASNGGLIYPFYYTSSETAPQKIGEEFSNLVANLPGVRGNLVFGDFSESNNTATGLVSGKICNQEIRGQIESVIGGGIAQIRMFWGAPNEFDNLKLAWQDVFSSFAKPNSVNYLKISGENFQAGLPNNWDFDELGDGLNLSSDDSYILFRLFKEGGVFDTTATLDAIVNDFTAQISLVSDDVGEEGFENDEGENQALFEVLRGQIVSEQVLDRDFEGKKWEIYWRILDFESSGKAKRALITASRVKEGVDVLVSWRDTLRSDWGANSRMLESIERTLISVGENDTLSAPFVVPVAGSSFTESLTSALQIDLLEKKNSWKSFILGIEKATSQSLNSSLWLPISGKQASGSYSIILPDNSKESLRPLR